MISNRNMQEIIGIILLIGTLISAAIVLVGGILFLYAHGSDPIQTELFHFDPQQMSLTDVWRFAFSWTPLGTIQLGVLLLVVTQIIRVALLCGYYASAKDYWFTIISLFIFLVLFYSLFWRSNY